MAKVIEAPADYATLAKMPDWRARVAMPVPLPQLNALHLSVLDKLLRSIGRLPDGEAANAAILAAPMFLSATFPLLRIALCVNREQASGIRLIGESQVLSYLRGNGDAPPPPVLPAGFSRKAGSLARRVARTKSWTPMLRLPRALLGADAVAVTHNTLLRQKAARHRGGVRFFQAERFAAALTGVQANAATDQVARTTAEILTGSLDVSPGTLTAPFRNRFNQLLWSYASAFAERAARDLAASRSIRRLPRNLWSGSAGAYLPRVLGLEAMRRGHEVVRFDHGGGIGFNSFVPVWHLVELAASSTFVLPTEALAARTRDRLTPEYLPRRKPSVIGDQGDPGMTAAARIPRSGGAPRPRVVYAPVPLRGERAFTPPLLPDVISLDWQMRLVEMLKKLPIDLILRPHPEGLLRGRCHPLNDIHPTEPRNFEALIGEADIFVFDYPQSTTVYEALATDRKIVYIDMGLDAFEGEIESLMRKRCHFVDASFDERGRPQVDPDALAGAVLDGPPSGDPLPFRRYFLAEGD